MSVCPLGEQLCGELEITGYKAAFKHGGFIQKGRHTGEEVIWSNSEATQREKTESRLVNPNVLVLHKQILEKNITLE